MVRATLLLSVFWVMGVEGEQGFKKMKTGLNWAAAQAYCRACHIDLVTINTREENELINKNSWLGLYRKNYSDVWRWSRGDEPLTFTNQWEDVPVPGQNCVYKHNGDGGPWTPKLCSETHDFFCLDDSLFLVTQMKTWDEALVHCRSLSSENRTYDLATLLTDEDRKYVKSMITDKVWIGLRFLGDRWMWVGGEEFPEDDLAKCPTIKRCGLVVKNSSNPYSIGNCSKKRHFFCYKKSPSVIPNSCNL